MADVITSPPSPNPAAVKVQVTCGDCVFFRTMKLENATAPCALMGCPSSRAPCNKLVPNVFTDDVAKAMDSKAIRDALNSVPDVALASIAMAMTHVSRLRAAGLKLGQRVYFNAAGDSAGRDYLANYYSGRVMMIDKEGNLLIRGPKLNATIARATVLDFNDWKAKRKALIAKRAFFDPKSPFTWERNDEAILTNPKYRPLWLDKEIAAYRASYFNAKATRQTHDYDAPPVKRGRGRPKGSGKVKSADVTSYGAAA